MPGSEPVPEADHLEQEMPTTREERDDNPVPPEAPEADVLEQAQPVTSEEAPSGIDAERVEPVDDEERDSTA